MARLVFDQDYIVGGSASTSITPNFRVREFADAAGRIRIHRELVAALQVLRNALDRTLSIESQVPAGALGAGLEGRFVWVGGEDPSAIADAARKLIREGWFALVEQQSARVYLEMPDPARPPPIAAELALDRAIQVTAGFETVGDPYQQVTGNFDGAGLSFGPLQFNFGTGTLQPLFRMYEQRDAAALQACFGTLWPEWQRVMQGSIPKQAAWAERYGGGWERVQALIAESAAQAERERADKEIQRGRDQAAALDRQRLRQFLFWGVVSSALAVLAIGFGVWAWRETTVARAAVLAKDEALADKDAALDALQLASDRREKQLVHVQDSLTKANAALANLDIAVTQAAPDSALSNAVSSARDQIVAQAGVLNQALQSPRLYVQVSANTQMDAALDLQRRIDGRDVGDAELVVPGIDLKRYDGKGAVLRCFTREECKAFAKPLAVLIQRELVSPPVDIQDFSSYGAKTKMRPRHFELWFGDGDIVLRSYAKKS